MKHLFFILAFIILVLLTVSIFFKSYFFPNGLNLVPGQKIELATLSPSSKTSKEVQFKIEEFASGFKIPWSMAFTSKDRVLVTEREGNIRVIENGVLKENPLYVFNNVSHTGEEGLLGMTLDPSYDSNKYLYVVVAYIKNGKAVEKIVRMKDLGDSMQEELVVLDDIPAAQFHDGGAIRFGPDGKLYVSTGDALDKNNAQELSSLSGKILRMNSDGSVPPDNPFNGSLIWSYGHRNPEGFDWYPDSKVMFETEHGPSLVDGPEGGDEVNVIESGENYGWPKAHHEIHIEGMVDPKIVFTPAFAPASGMFYKSKVFPQFYGNFFFGGLKGEGIIRVIVDPTSPSKMISYEKMEGIDYGRIRDVEEGLDGYIYFTTSNRDGRGTPRERDDKIYRLVPSSKK